MWLYELLLSIRSMSLAAIRANCTNCELFGGGGVGSLLTQRTLSVDEICDFSFDGCQLLFNKILHAY